MFSQYFRTEEKYIEWVKQEKEWADRRALRAIEIRELKAARTTRRPVMFSKHTINTSVSKNRPDARTCVWLEERIEPIVGVYIGYRYKFEGKWKDNLDNYYEPGEGCYFAQSKTIEVWLFVTHENRKPIAVSPFDIKQNEEVEL